MTVGPELNHFRGVKVLLIHYLVMMSTHSVTLCLSGYLESFEELRSQEQDRMTASQENNVSLLELCSRVSVRVRPLTSSAPSNTVHAYKLCVCVIRTCSGCVTWTE